MPKEVKALLKFWRDSECPLRVTVASILEGENSISVTYPIEWEWCEATVAWFLSKFTEAALRDGLQQLPVMAREGVSWLSVLRKENNLLRVVLHEKMMDEVVASTPKDCGIPPLILYGPREEIRLGCAGLDVAEAYLRMLYPGKMSLTEQLPSKEWTMIGAIGDGVTSGTIPDHHKSILDESLAVQVVAWNKRITDAGKRTQNYDKGLDRFVRKFDPDQELVATIAIAKGVHQDHGLAVYTAQQKR
jgi:hypothetical protein